ncbi:Thioredoxin-like superfamily [Sesbania bispinosa]|nr:Thioredoxin-like superfamily [Sesbania bispinosa]
MSLCASPPFSHHLVIPPASTSRHQRLTGRHVIRPCARMSLNNDNNPNLNSSSVLSALTNLLWGKSQPPGLLVSTVRTAWNSTWQLMMSQLAPSDSSGGYSRPGSKFRFSGPPPPRSLHLYVGLACPWAHRTLILRALKGLEEAVPVSVASPGLDGSWEFKRVGGADT